MGECLQLELYIHIKLMSKTLRVDYNNAKPKTMIKALHNT